LFGHRAGSKGIALRVTLDPKLPRMVVGDRAALLQILANLLDNAVRFTPRGEVRLEVAPLPDAPEGFDSAGTGAPWRRWLRFRVRDTGVGIAADKLPEIFRRFVIAEDFLRKEFGGAGVGLSVARDLAALHGGHITVASQPGEGSLFSLEIPFEAA
jgi:signal transduction histidine kinase